MAIKRRMRDGTIKYISYKHEGEDNENVPSETLTEDSEDLEIKRLEAVIELLESRIKQLETNKPKEEAPSSDVDGVGAVAAASSYSCYN